MENYFEECEKTFTKIENLKKKGGKISAVYFNKLDPKVFGFDYMMKWFPKYNKIRCYEGIVVNETDDHKFMEVLLGKYLDEFIGLTKGQINVHLDYDYVELQIGAIDFKFDLKNGHNIFWVGEPNKKKEVTVVLTEAIFNEKTTFIMRELANRFFINKEIVYFIPNKIGLLWDIQQ